MSGNNSWMDAALRAARYAGETMGNVPSSAVNAAKGVAHVVRHPVESANDLASVLAGAAYHAGVPKPPTWLAPAGEYEHDKAAASALVNAYRSRYGSLGAAGKTLRQDPIGALMDASAVLGGGETALARVAPRMSKVLGTAANLTNPAHVALKTAAAVPGAQPVASALTVPFRRKARVLDDAGAPTPAAVRAVVESGVDPHLLNRDLINTWHQISADKGVSPMSLRQALLEHTGVSTPTRGVTLGERASAAAKEPAASAVSAGREEVQRSLAGHAPVRSTDAGNDFIQNGLAAQTARDQAYAKLGHNPGVFDHTSIDDFYPTLEETLAKPEHGGLPSTLELMQGSTHLPETQKLLFGGRGVSSLRDRLATMAENTRRLELDEDAAPTRQNAPGALTTSEIEGLRQEINAAYPKAKGPDLAGLNYVKDALDTWMADQIAKGRFSGNGEAVLGDMTAARKAHQDFVSTYENNPNPAVNTAWRAVAPYVEATPQRTAALAQGAPLELPSTVQQILENSIVKPGTMEPVRASGVRPSGEQTLSQLASADSPLPVLSPSGVDALHASLKNPAYSGTRDSAQLERDLNGPLGHLFTPEEQTALRQHTAALDLLGTPDSHLPPSGLDANSKVSKGLRAGAAALTGAGAASVAAHLFPVAPGLASEAALGAIGALGSLARDSAPGGISRKAAEARTAQELAGAPTAYQVPRFSAALEKGADVAPSLALVDHITQPQAAEQKQPVAAAPAPLTPNDLASDFATPAETSAPEGSGKDAPAPRPTLSAQDLANDFSKPAGDRLKDDQREDDGHADGGRVARKSGGRVEDIEPLIRGLMRKAERVRKHTAKSTEPLLNHGDDAIIAALNAAKQGI